MKLAKISIATLSDSPLISQSAGDFRCEGPVEVHRLIGKHSDPLHLYYYSMKPGAILEWDKSNVDSCAYILEGAVEVNGVPLGEGGCFIVEHGSDALVVSTGRTKVALFQDRNPQSKNGGKVHVIADENVPQVEHTPDVEDVASALLADAMCPTCDLWLHRNVFPEGYTIELHSHSEDEIIFVTSGEILLGNRRYGPDTALAIAKKTIYAFKAGLGGMAFINFRTGSPTANLSETKETMDEGEFFRTRLGIPEHTFV